MREKANYRDYIEQLNMYFPDKEVLNLNEVATVLGVKSPSTVKRLVPCNKGRITKVALAHAMCDL